MIIHCTTCHHEWQVTSIKDQPKCDWCGSKGKVSRHPARIPVGKPTEWHRDKKRYRRNRKHKKESDYDA